ncbi:MAG: MurR/RpiR family transcriptional regulator [Chloroflexi bacterium]|nr:MurR/RpiR family transcriptional regulator [Chloroflexota bacterium]
MNTNQTSADVIEQLRKRYDELTDSQKRIAEAIVEDPDFVAFATVDQFGSKLGLNPSTIVRFAYRLGLDGYNDLQDRVRERVRAQLSKRDTTDVEGTQALTAHLGGTVFAKSFEHDLDILRRTISRLNTDELTRAVDALVRARRVFLAGGFSSYGIAHYMSLALSRIRGDTFLLGPSEADAAAVVLQLIGEDVLVVFTFPPYASSTLRIVRQAKSQGATVVAITDSPISPVGQLVNIVLPAFSSGMSTQNSHVPALALANALLNAVVAATPATALERYRRVMQLMNEGDAFVLKGGEG